MTAMSLSNIAFLVIAALTVFAAIELDGQSFAV
jgi:hypothetical protein